MHFVIMNNDAQFYNYVYWNLVLKLAEPGKGKKHVKIWVTTGHFFIPHMRYSAITMKRRWKLVIHMELELWQKFFLYGFSLAIHLNYLKQF